MDRLEEKEDLSQKIKEVNDQLLAIFDNIGDGISVIDKDYQILRVNRGILEIFDKRDFSDLIGKRCFIEYYKNEGVCENCPAQKTLEEGRTSHHVNKIWNSPDKGLTILDTFTFPIINRDGEIIQVIEYIKNITEIVKLEDHLLYQERLAGIGELASGIAHEIRNPLGNIAAAAQFCLNKYKLHKVARKHLRIILKNSEHANRTVKDLLDFAKPSEISFKVGHLGEIIDSVCIMVKTRCSKQHVRLIKRWSRRLPHILLLDERRLEEAFLNLILNALDAMPKGGRLAISAYPDIQNNEVVINFSDTGIGIPQENLTKIFNPFFTTKDEGVGLGLTLVQEVIRCHKGKIEIESRVEQGTEVRVRLPISREGVKGNGGPLFGENSNS